MLAELSKGAPPSGTAPETAPDATQDMTDMCVDEDSREALDKALVLTMEQPDGPLQKAARQAAIDKYIPAAKRCRVKVPSGG